MNIEPRVSIVIPVKGGESLLRALDSVSRQLYQDWECLIIDDGIDRAVLDTLTILIDNDGRFRLFKSEGKGISSALNTGIKYALGTYIARLDDDDVWYPFHLATLVGVLENNNSIEIVGSKVDLTWTPRVYHQMTTDNPYFQLVQKNPFNHPAVVYRKSLVSSLDLIYNSDYDGFEDYELWSRILTPTNGLLLNIATLVYTVSNVNKEQWWYRYLIFRHQLCQRFSREFNKQYYVEQVIYND